MSVNPVDEYPVVRKALYLVQWLANGVLVVAGAVFVVLGTSTDDLPRWYVLALAVGPVLWAYLGLTAQTNVTDTRRTRRSLFDRERGYADLRVAGLVTAFVAVIALVLSFVPTASAAF